MKRASIVVVDAAHARLFTYTESEGGPTLSDEHSLSNSERQVQHQFTDAAGMTPGVVGSGGQPGTSHKGGHGTADDHRSGHMAELDHRFAKTIVGELTARAKASKSEHVIIVAAPAMLGVLRKETGALEKSGIALTELDQNLGGMSLSQIQDKLAHLGLIGAHKRPANPNAH